MGGRIGIGVEVAEVQWDGSGRDKGGFRSEVE